MRIVYHHDAELELIEAAEFYEKRVATLGAQFLDAADKAVIHISDAPDRWRIVEMDVRRYIMPRFPFTIYYRIMPDHIRVLAFAHQSRDPWNWRRRIEDD
jgi:hypothetical protein